MYVVEREASGDFDYLWDDPADADGLTSDDEVLEVQPAEELDPRRRIRATICGTNRTTTSGITSRIPMISRRQWPLRRVQHQHLEFQAATDAVVPHQAGAHRDHRGIRRRGRDRGVRRAAGVPRPGRHRRRGDVVGDPDRTDQRRSRFRWRPARHRHHRHRHRRSLPPPEPATAGDGLAGRTRRRGMRLRACSRDRQKARRSTSRRSPISVAPQPRTGHSGLR